MFVSTEVRWFCEGSMPPGVLDWLHRAGRKLQEQPLRVDYYLGLGECDSLGIKLREGRIEIKLREARYGIVQLGPRFAGVMERWRKWGWALAEPGAGPAPDWVSTPAWIGVAKKRWVLMYHTGLEQGIAPTPDGEVSGQGCQVELAKIQAQGRESWSLSFESFGAEAAGREALLLVAAHLFSGEPAGLPLSAGNSYGYPRWLAMPGEVSPRSG